MYKQAGIVEQHLKICLEPEAATIFTYESNQNLFHPGRKFIVVDAGGKYIEYLLYNNMHCISVSPPPPPAFFLLEMHLQVSREILE